MEGLEDIHPSDLVGRYYLQPEHNSDGTRYRCKVVQALKEHEENLGKDKARQRFLVCVNDGEYEDIVAYNNILDYISSDNTSDEPFWKFKRIIVHQDPLTTIHPDYKGSRYNVIVEQETGETTAKPLSVFGQDAPVVCALYAKEKRLLEEEVWKRFKSIAKQEKSYSLW